MKNKSGNTNGQQKRDSATRSAGKQATGNRNKHLLAAERRRTDEPHGRLNKQNPVSPQNDELNKSKDAGLRKSILKLIDDTRTQLLYLEIAVCNNYESDFYFAKKLVDSLYEELQNKLDELKKSLRFAG